MMPAEFNYHKAESIHEALSMLKEHGADAKLLAGGHSLLPAMKLRLNKPATLIDIGRIPELRFIEEEGNEIVIGSASTHHDIARSNVLRKKISMMSEAAELIGDLQVRNMGTLGGSIAHADPAADWPALLLAAGATIVVKSQDGSRSIPAGDFFTGFYTTALEPEEIITEVRLPAPPPNTHSSYQKFMQPASRFAIVGCAAMVTMQGNICDQVRVAFTGVSTSPFRDTKVEDSLNGKAATEENIKRAADQAATGVEIMSDHFASEEYRQHLAKVYAKRALTAAAE
jgi:carbon-monoxide dehydrogenase medium subunit